MSVALGAIVGVAENGNSAELVTVGPGHQVVDRRRVELTHGLPTHPHHHEGSWAVGRYRDTAWSRDVSLKEALALIETVRDAAAQGAREALALVASRLALPIRAIAIRACPDLPATAEERIRDNRAQSMADSVMYRQALANAAAGLGWRVHWYARERAFADAAAVVGCDDIDAFLREIGRKLGPPWQARHKLATAAAIAAMGDGNA